MHATLGSSSAQETEPTPCETRCEDQHLMCITACGTSNDVIDCEAGCDDRLQDCQQPCS